MSFVLAFAAFAALVILHEFGHFIAAKAVGMRVERFSLFFPPAIFKVQRGETSYEIGSIPLGGFVKISGMNPEEELSPEVEHRAYHRLPVWKRIVTIAAGPAMNMLIALVLVFVLFAFVGVSETNTSVAKVDPGAAAAGSIRSGDRIVSINGKSGTPQQMANELNRAAKCARARTNGCRAQHPLPVVIRRDGVRRTFMITPRYDATAKSMRLGISFGFDSHVTIPPIQALSAAAAGVWRVTKITVSLPARVFNAKERKQIHGVAGGFEITRKAISSSSTEQTIGIIALISLSLAIINLFPFLPLDGGHIFWALAEKLRGRPIPTRVMERASVIGIALIAMLFIVGFTNDIETFRNGGFGP